MAEPTKTSNLPFLHQSTIERPALREKIGLALEHKLTLISAPPGYGKTTLVAQFARQINLPIAWHTVTETERDLPQLLTHSLAALGEIVTGSEALTLGSATTPMEAANAISDWLRHATSGNLIYVLDDVHHILGAPRVESWLRAFVKAVPSTCHVILVGRALPPLPLMEMVTHREVLALGQEQLRFTFDEIQTLAHQLGITLSAIETHNIITRLDGWAAGTVLALQPLPEALESTLWRGKPGPEALFDSLAEVMLATQDSALQDFLLDSSTLTRVTPSLCQIALQLPESRNSVFEAVSRNLFISQTSGGLTYHPLFRSFLQRHLQSLDPVRFAQLHERAGYWFESTNRLEEAFDHYMSAQNLPQAVRLAERAAMDYGAQGKSETVLYWAGQLSSARMECPHLLYTCATIHVDRYAFEEATEELLIAAEGFQRQQNYPCVVMTHLLHAGLYNRQGNYQRAVQVVDETLSNYTVPDNYRGLALYVRGSADLHLGNLEAAMQQLESALPLYRATGDGAALSELLLELEYAYMRVGRFDEATAFLQEAITIRSGFSGSAGLVVPLNNLGYDYHLLGNYSQARQRFQEGLEAATRAGMKREECYLLWSLADLERDIGAFDEARALYDKALRYTNATPALRCATLIGLATLQRWQGDPAASLATAADAEALAARSQLPLEHAQASLATWAVQAQQGQSSAARRALEQITAKAKSQQAASVSARALVLYAFSALLEHDVAAAGHALTIVEGVGHAAHLQPSVAEIVHLPLLNTFVQGHSSRYPLLIAGIKALEAALAETFVQEAPRHPTPPRLTYSLRVSVLGREAIDRDGEPVPLSAWRAAEARKLFFYLLLKGAATRDQLGLALWPESGSQQVKLKFHSTLHRARNAVGTNAIQFEEELYSISPDLDLWCDAVEFGTLVQEARLSPPSRAHSETLWRRAVELYTGELLPDVDAEWLISAREGLHEMYLESLFALGNCIRQRSGLREAIPIYQQALEIDPYREEIHRAMLSCYAALGERSLVRRHVERLTQLLALDLGITPSVETRTLVQSLLS